MRALHINFAPKTWQQRLASYPLWGWLLMGVAALAIVTMVAQAWALEMQLQPLDEEIASLQSRQAAREKAIEKRKPVPIPADTVRSANAVIDQLNTPWGDLLDAIENTATSQVALLEISPDSSKRRLRAKAEVKSTDDMLAFIERVKQHGFFKQVNLIKHEVNAQDKNNPIRFEFEAFWSGVSP